MCTNFKLCAVYEGNRHIYGYNGTIQFYIASISYRVSYINFI